MQRSLEHSRVDFAPVPIRPGYEALIVSVMFLATTIGELASFRWRRPVLAVLLPIVLFSVSLVVGTGAAGPLLTLLFLGALLTYWALESSHRMRAWGRWVSAWTHHRNPEPASLSGGLARSLGATCLAAALVSPLFLPALGDGLVSWRSGLGGGLGEGSGSGGNGVDPWVSITPSLVNQSTDVLFEVETDEAAYWRVATLERFDGDAWHEETTSRNELDGADVGGPRPPLTHSEEIGYSLVSTGLGGDALPTAPTAVVVRSEGDAELRVDPDSGNVFVPSGIETGDAFTVVSALPDVNYKELRRADPGTSEALAPTYFEVPRPPAVEVMTLLEEWTEEAKTPYEKLVAIQGQLRGYAYTLTPESPRGEDYVADFMLRTRAGYCQQYATAFAMSARYLGFPARVSVGFLPGERDLGSGTSLVRGEDAHAWPEVFFPEYGWIAFEPTPRGGFGAVPPTYTSEPIEDGLAGINPGNPFSSTGQESGQGGAALDDPLQQPGGGEDVEVRGGLRGAEDAPGSEPAETQAWQRTFGRMLTVLIIALLVFLIAVPLLKEMRIRRRYARSTDPDDIAASAFVHFQDEAAELADERHPWESAMTYATRMRTTGALGDGSARRLAELYEMAAYAAVHLTTQQAAEAKRLAQKLRGQLWSGAPWPARVARLFSPRRLRSLG